MSLECCGTSWLFFAEIKVPKSIVTWFWFLFCLTSSDTWSFPCTVQMVYLQLMSINILNKPSQQQQTHNHKEFKFHNVFLTRILCIQTSNTISMGFFNLIYHIFYSAKNIPKTSQLTLLSQSNIQSALT